MHPFYLPSNRSTPARACGHLILALLFLWALLAETTQASNLRLPDMGEASGSVMTPVEEQRLGEAFMREVRRSGKVLSDPLVTEYIQALGDRLTRNGEALGHRFHFFLVDDPSVNAFAGPGGHIGVHTGLVLSTRSESELASVLAHEIAHITQKHLLRAFDSAGQSSLTMVAAILAAILIGASTKNPDATLAAVTASQAAAIQTQINFTRNNEKEADSIGMAILADSGYDPNGMPDFFEQMGRATRYYDTQRIPEFLLTHPVTTNRIAESRQRASAFTYRQVAESMDYHLLRTILKIHEFVEPSEAARYYAGGLEEKRYRNESAHQFGLAMAKLHAGEAEQAEALLDQLLSSHPYQPAVVILKARILLNAGKGERAVALLNDAAAMRAGSRALLIAQAEALLELGRSEEAEVLLESRVRFGSSDTLIYQMLSQAAGRNGHTTLGHLYRAESLYHAGALEEAKRQLQIAMEGSDLDYYYSARVAARLNAVNQELIERHKRAER